MWSGPAMATGTGTPRPIARAVSEPGITATGSDPGLSGQLAAAAREVAVSRSPTPVPVRAQSAGDSANQSMPSSQSAELPKRSALGMFGWLLLGAILFGGVGALVYVALGERGERQPPASTQPQIAPSSDPVGSGTAAPQPDKLIEETQGGGASGSAKTATPSPSPGGSNADVAPGPGKGVGSAQAPDEPDKDRTPPDKTGQATKKDPPSTKKPPEKKPPPKKVVAAADEKDPKALIKQGEALEAQGEWAEARGVWTKLEKIKGYQAQAVYKQAWSAFSAQDTDAAVRLASKAALMPGAYKNKAKFLYGDALYRQGAYDRAKDIYVGLWKQTAGDDKALAQKKVAACNRMLKKPESDGLVN